MKVKRFNNLWAMGLILFGAILIAFYVIKIFFPEFVVGVAQIPEVVAFGTYVDTHWWAYYLFTFVVSFVSGYFYCCACCRKPNLSKIEIGILVLEIIILFIIEKLLFEFYFNVNIVFMLLMPTIMCKLNNSSGIKYLFSTITTFSIYSFAQIFSINIRDIGVCVINPNSATFTILVIDAYICLFLLYNFFNNKEIEKIE